MGVLSSLIGGGMTAGESHGGSVNSSYNASNNFSDSVSNSWSQTNGTQAGSESEAAAERAFQRQKELMLMEMEFNSKEAQKARDFNEKMANTVYTRSVNNMKEAGINPILAASMGLSGASVGSGATASISGATAPMAQSFANSSSASNSWSHSEGMSHGGSSGSSWNDSTYGLSTAIEQLGDKAQDFIDSASNIVMDDGIVGMIANTVGSLFGAASGAMAVTQHAAEAAKNKK